MKSDKKQPDPTNEMDLPVVDEHAGKGGSYIVTADGKRELAHRTEQTSQGKT